MNESLEQLQVVIPRDQFPVYEAAALLVGATVQPSINYECETFPDGSELCTCPDLDVTIDGTTRTLHAGEAVIHVTAEPSRLVAMDAIIRVSRQEERPAEIAEA
jgi:hypothetical protein